MAAPDIKSFLESDQSWMIYQGRCQELVAEMPDGIVPLTISSPPYFMGKSYDRSKSLTDFVNEHADLAPQLERVTASSGSLCWQVGNHVEENVVTPLDFAAHQAFSSNTSFTLRNRIVWHFRHGTNASRRFSGRHETVLWYTKGNTYHFDLDAVRVPQIYPGKKHYKGPKQGAFSGNPKGKNPSDVWDIPNVKSNHVEKTDHPCQFPVALAERLILALSKPGDLIFDPYSGSASTGIAALKNGRRFLGAELSAEYCELSAERIKLLEEGMLRTRPLDLPIWRPSPGDPICTPPAHFLTSGKSPNGQGN